MNDESKTGFEIKGKFTLRDVLLLLSLLGIGGHTYYTQSSFSEVQKKLDACEVRLLKLERALSIPPGPNPAGDTTGPPPKGSR